MDRRINPYNVLGVAPDADPEVIRAAYRALARKTLLSHLRPNSEDNRTVCVIKVSSDFADMGTPQIGLNLQSSIANKHPHELADHYQAYRVFSCGPL